ncbi:MAG: diacylglycerol kinase [Opitutales bacterium]|nr:diacylglycerol kinase [Opitutales bacterium]
MATPTDVTGENTLPAKGSGVKRVLHAGIYSLEGIGSALKHEAAFRQEAILALFMVPLALLLPVGVAAKAILVASVFLVLIVELLNSAVEWVVDYISLERHAFAKRAKDMGSAAVFLSLLNCGLLWALVLSAYWSEIRLWAGL